MQIAVALLRWFVAYLGLLRTANMEIIVINIQMRAALAATTLRAPTVREHWIRNRERIWPHVEVG